MMIGTSLRAALLGMTILAAGQAIAGPTFHFTFDGTADGATTAPFVGSGTMTLNNDPGVGTFALDSVGGYSLSFTVGSQTFTEADITTTPSTVLLLISGTPGAETLKFSNTSGFGDGGSSGSIDLLNGPGLLSFEPPAYGGNLNLYLMNGPGGETYFGNYSATQQSAAPEPASWAMMLSGFGLVGGALRRRKLSVRFA